MHRELSIAATATRSVESYSDISEFISATYATGGTREEMLCQISAESSTATTIAGII